MSKPKSHEETHSVIICIDCGQTREIRNQDIHEVVRCKDCQKQHRIISRRISRTKEIVNNEQ